MLLEKAAFDCSAEFVDGQIGKLGMLTELLGYPQTIFAIKQEILHASLCLLAAHD